MIIGKELKYLKKNKWSFVVHNYLGTLDLHSQIRLKPVINFCNGIIDKENIKILEFGCGNGSLSFALARANKSLRYLGIDLNEIKIQNANYIHSLLNLPEQIQYICHDITKIRINGNDKFDILLLTDVIEHIENPLEVLLQIKNFLKKGSLIIISVPTANYIKYFGKKFNDLVGHKKKEGYNLLELTDLMKSLNANLITHKYNTGLFSNIGCAISYRLISKYYKIEQLKNLFLYFFKYFDLFNHPKISCSLFAVFKIE